MIFFFIISLIFRFLLTYKLSQDPIELFFSAVRSKGGFNNNPSAQQFKIIFKKLLVHHELSHVNSNVQILNVSSKKCTENHEDDFFCGIEEIDVNSINLSPCIENIIEYIAGFISRNLKKHLTCDTCATMIEDKNEHYLDSFISFKNRGGLIFPSKDVIKICTQA